MCKTDDIRKLCPLPLCLSAEASFCLGKANEAEDVTSRHGDKSWPPRLVGHTIGPKQLETALIKAVSRLRDSLAMPWECILIDLRSHERTQQHHDNDITAHTAQSLIWCRQKAAY